jgi:hypothetical protein
MSTTQRLKVDGIRIDGGTQPRALINEDIVSEYANDLTEGVVFPPVTVFYDGSDHWLADGFHRLHAHKKVELRTIECEVQKGSLRLAVLFACAANQNHGLRRSQADKRQAVILLLDDQEWCAWSDRKIASVCGVSHTFVGEVRREWAKGLSVNVATPAETRTVQRGDQSYPMDTGNIGSSSQTADAEEAESVEPAGGNGRSPAKPDRTRQELLKDLDHRQGGSNRQSDRHRRLKREESIRVS